MVKLNLGCGDKILPGYINVDIDLSRSEKHPDSKPGSGLSRTEKRPDLDADIRDLSRIKPSIADEILAVHVIEHFYYWEVAIC